MPDHEHDTCWIESTLDDTGKAACLLRWGPIRALLTPPAVLAAARDLVTAAISAETDIALIDVFREELRADDELLGMVLTRVRQRRPMPPAPVALRIQSVAGARTGQPLVHIARGSMRSELTPAEARDMASQWTQAAVAAQIDVRLRYALGEWDRLNVVEIEDLFSRIREAGR